MINKGIPVKWQTWSEHYNENTGNWRERPAICVKDCPLSNPPVEVVKQGNEAILKWLTALGKRPILETKVMFIGDSGYGKTHMIEMLMHGKICRKIDTTLGIERNRLADAASPEGPIRINVWDLGGQEFMRSTHQFFFTQRTLYVLVTDARQGEKREDLRHWLNLVKTLGDNAPVLVAINKIDTNDHDIDRERLQREYSNIKGFVRTSIKNKPTKGINAKKTIAEFKQMIDRTVSDKALMPSVFALQREEWFTVKESLENDKRPYITVEDYRNLPQIKDLLIDEQDFSLEQMAFIGTVISYYKDTRLKDTHVIDPAWIMNGIYDVLNDAQVKEEQKGQFGFRDMKRILPRTLYPDSKLVFLTDLMQKFRLCFPLRGTVDTFLLPDLFSDAEPANIWEEKNALRFRLNYDDYPPDMFMAQFIAEKYRSIEGEKRWRNGVVLSDGHCRAIVRRMHRREHIEIEVAGSERQRRGYLRMIREVFYELHEPFETLKPKEEIPYKSEWLDFRDLLKAEAEGDKTYRIPGSERIQLTELLDGYAVDEDRIILLSMVRDMESLKRGQREIKKDTKQILSLNEQQLDLLMENKEAGEKYLQVIEQGLKALEGKLPTQHALTEKRNGYLEATDLKLKFKIGHEMLGGVLEVELAPDVKKVFRQMKKDADQILSDFKAGYIFTKPK